MSEDNRQRPHIIRVLPTVNKRVRAYAARQGVAPNVAAEALINGAAGEIAALDQAHAALRSDLESAREATRRADAEVERLQRELASLRGGLDLATETIVRVLRERDAALSELAEVRAALETKGATDRLAERVETIAAAGDRAPRNKWRRVVSPDLAARVDARIDARPGRDFVFVLENGCSRLEASDDYQDRQKAAKRAARSS